LRLAGQKKAEFLLEKALTGGKFTAYGGNDLLWTSCSTKRMNMKLIKCRWLNHCMEIKVTTFWVQTTGTISHWEVIKKNDVFHFKEIENSIYS